MGRVCACRSEAINLRALDLVLFGKRRVKMQTHEQIGFLPPGDLRPVGQRNETVAVARERDYQAGVGQHLTHFPGQQQRVFLLLPAALLVAGVFAAVTGIEANAQDGHTDRVLWRKQHRMQCGLQIQQRDKQRPMARGHRGREVDHDAVDRGFL